MTAAPHSIDPATYLEDLLAQASPDLMRQMLQGFINQILSAQAALRLLLCHTYIERREEMFQYKCHKCGTRIADNKGCIYVSLFQAAKRRQEVIERAEKTDSSLEFVDMSQLKMRQKAMWHPYHSDCWSGASEYHIEVRRLRNFEQYASWTAHLCEKNWFAFTDWTTFTRHYLKPRDA